MMQQITRSVIRKLKRMKWRLIAIVLVVSMAMGLTVAGFYGGAVYDTSIDSLIERSKLPDLFIGLDGPTDEAVVAAAIENATARATTGDAIAATQLRLKREAMYEHGGERFPAVVIGVHDPARSDINELSIESGHLFAAVNNTGQGVAVAGMEDEGVKAGASVLLELGSQTLAVNLTGTVNCAEYLFTSAYTDYTVPMSGSLVVVFVPIADLSAVGATGANTTANQTTNQVNEVLVLYTDGDRGSDTDAVRTAVLAALEHDGVEAVTITAQDEHPSVVFMEIGAAKLKSMMPLMGVIFLFVGFIAIFMTMIRLVQNDSRYIGVLMSLGYPRGRIVGAYLAAGAIIAAIGAGAGIALGFAFTKSFVDVAVNVFFSGLEIVYPLDPIPFILGGLWTTGVVLLSVWLPVRMITRQSVREALEYKPRAHVTSLRGRGRRRGRGRGPKRGQGHGQAARSARSARSPRLSRVALMGLRNTVRNPRRLAVTVVVVGITIGVAGSWLVMIDSAFGYMTDQLETDTWDLRVDFLAPAPTAAVNETFIGLGDGQTEYVVPFTYLTGEARSGSQSSGTTVIGCDELQRIKNYDLRSGSVETAPVAGEAIITHKLADEIEAGPGDTITLALGAAETEVTVTAVAYDIMTMVVYTPRQSIAPLTTLENCSGAFVKLAPDADGAASVAPRIRQQQAVAQVVVHSEIAATFDEILVMANGFLYTFFVMFLLITVVVTGSVVILSTMERDVEFATLDTLGISKWKVARSIMIEMGVIGALAAAIGIPFSYLFAQILMLILADVIFYFPITLAIGATVTIFCIGLIFVLASSFIPIRYAGQLETEQTIRERTAG